MFKPALGSVAGFVILIAVVFVALMERGQGEIRFFDWHAATVVLGGVCGSLLIALKGSTFGEMIRDAAQIVVGNDSSNRELESLQTEIKKMEIDWQSGRRGEVLSLTENPAQPEIAVAADVLIQHAQGARLAERFEELRVLSSRRFMPQIEGWDMVARLAPSFGIVGTVAGMIQLFRNMADHTGNLGGAMSLALLATLYGILLGAAVGGPMSTRLNQRLNEHLNLIDLLEKKVAALIDDDRSRKRGGAEVMA